MSKANSLGLQCLGELGKSLVSQLRAALSCRSIVFGLLGVSGC